MGVGNLYNTVAKGLLSKELLQYQSVKSRVASNLG